MFCFYTVPSEVVNFQVDVSSSKQFLVSWNPPHSPNGVIIGYNITVIDPLESSNFSVAGDQNQLPVTVGKRTVYYVVSVSVVVMS